MQKNKLLIMLVLIVVLFNMGIAYALPRGMSVYLNPSEVQYQLIDPFGNIAGYDPVSKTIINNIPNMHYRFTVEPTGPLEPTKYEKYYIIQQNLISDTVTIATGMYKIKVIGSIAEEKYKLIFHVYYHGLMYPRMALDIDSSIYPNVAWTYEFTIPDVPTPTGEMILTKVAQPSDLLTDLTTAGQLGYIGNTKFVTELTKEINEIEAEKAKGKVDDGLTPAQKAKKGYTELLNEITEKYNKPESDEFVKKEAYDVLREDLEYIIGHL